MRGASGEPEGTVETVGRTGRFRYSVDTWNEDGQVVPRGIWWGITAKKRRDGGIA